MRMRGFQMSKFIESANTILLNIGRSIDEQMVCDTALLVSGGVAYESTKYDDPSVPYGDIDTLLLVDDLSELMSKNENDFYLNIGFDAESFTVIDNLDFSLFTDGLISIIRFTGAINGIKATLNVTTFERIYEIYEKNEQAAINKLAHTDCLNIIYSVGSDGGETLLGMFSPEISNLMNDAEQMSSHYLVLDRNWYRHGKVLHAGVFTDFIAKSKIIKDTKNNDLERLIRLILSKIKNTASSDIKKSNEWPKLFASSHLFSDNFRQKISEYINGVLPNKEFSIINFPDYPRLPISVFAEPDQYKSSSTDIAKNNESLMHGYEKHEDLSLHDISKTNIGRNEAAYLLNAEIKRIIDLLCSSKLKDSSVIPADSSLKNLAYIDNSKLLYIDNNFQNGSLIESLVYSVDEIISDYSKTNQIINMIAGFRIDTLEYVLNNCSSAPPNIMELGNKKLIDYKKEFPERYIQK